jgi:two-component system CheB/CheR fusion protein
MRALFASRETAASRVATLTPREHEILELILAGHPNKIIAWKLGISQRTVENHRAAIMHKTGSTSVPALARLAIAAAWNGADAPPVQPLPRAAVAGAPGAMAKRVVHVDLRKR